jgi:hypothetical protein
MEAIYFTILIFSILILLISFLALMSRGMITSRAVRMVRYHLSIAGTFAGTLLWFWLVTVLWIDLARNGSIHYGYMGWITLCLALSVYFFLFFRKSPEIRKEDIHRPENLIFFTRPGR